MHTFFRLITLLLITFQFNRQKIICTKILIGFNFKGFNFNIELPKEEKSFSNKKNFIHFKCE